MRAIVRRRSGVSRGVRECKGPGSAMHLLLEAFVVTELASGQPPCEAQERRELRLAAPTRGSEGK